MTNFPARMVGRAVHSPAVGLWFLAPLVAEFFLGDFSIVELPLLLPLSLWYGGCALAIREVVRVRGGGWPSIVLLGLAFGLVEEGLLTMSLFAPDYLGQHLTTPGHVDSLGIGVPWTIFVLTLHTAWSIATPIALMEEASGGRRHVPWLNRRGHVVLGVLVTIGAVVTSVANQGANDGYVASLPQLATTVVLVVVLIGIALSRRGRGGTASADHRCPPAVVVGACTVAAGVVFESSRPAGTVPGTAMMIVAIAVVIVAVVWWSRSTAWGGVHRVAVAGGAVAVYVGNAFSTGSGLGSASTILGLVTHVVFALMGAAIVAVCARRARRSAAVETRTLAGV